MTAHVTFRDVLDFWLCQEPEKHFKPDPAFDEEIRERFGAAHEQAKAGAYDSWAETPEGALALVILLDQFARNIHRGTPQVYAADEKALAVARAAVEHGQDLELTENKRSWFYLPFMHSESLADQERCVALAERSGLEDTLKWARHHADIIRRYGRFPHRNALLGRNSTPEEEAFIADGGFGG